MIEQSDEEYEEDEEDTVPQLVTGESTTANYTNDELHEYRQQLENEISFSEVKSTKQADDSIRKYIESCTQYLGNIKIGPEVEIPEGMPLIHDNSDCKDKAIETTDANIETASQSKNDETAPLDETNTNDAASDKADNNSDAVSLSSNDLETDDVPELADMDPNSRKYRLKMVEKLLSDARSHRSFSTTASTIAPSVITDRIKRNLDKKERIDMRKRSVAKGEASAVHRHRKENKDVVKEYAGWDF